MGSFSENYYLRKQYLEQNEVPTQSVMMAKMSPPLAKVYFKSMTPKLKVLAGLEPPMKGGGNDWFIPPKDLLKSKAILKPIKNEYLSKLSYGGIAYFGENIVQDYHKQLEEEKRKILLESDIKWKRDIEASCQLFWEEKSKIAEKQNTAKIRDAFHEFTTVYKTSITKIEQLIMDASISEIERVRTEAHAKMMVQYETLLKQQATMLYDRYAKRLEKDKERRKTNFIRNIDVSGEDMCKRVHDINVEKHLAIEQLRWLLERQNLACQIYVALKEREECEKEMQISKDTHKEQTKVLDEQIKMKDFEIQLAQEKAKKCKEFNLVWLKKICHVVKRFQYFVSYCLSSLPEYADFFINMEKLMLLQISEAMENPEVESIIVSEKETFHTPVPKPHAFYLFWDKGYRTLVDENLCPKHCTSSATLLPAILVNNKCIYASCDNLEVFADKIKDFIDGRRGDDIDFTDDHDYTYDVPVKYTSSKQLTEIKLQSSLMQLLQKEFPNLKEVPMDPSICKPCFCNLVGSGHVSRTSLNVHEEEPKNVSPKPSVSPGERITSRDAELEHEREPKWESYIKFITSTRCKCPKKSKKTLQEHLPPYMRNMSAFEAPDLPYYEPCSLKTLKKLVKKARGIKTPPPPPEKVESKTRDVSTQYSDQEYDNLCTCLSEDEVDRLFRELLKVPDLYTSKSRFRVADGSLSTSYLDKPSTSFAIERAGSLKHLLDDSSELKEIFVKRDCQF